MHATPGKIKDHGAQSVGVPKDAVVTPNLGVTTGRNRYGLYPGYLPDQAQDEPKFTSVFAYRAAPVHQVVDDAARKR